MSSLPESPTPRVAIEPTSVSLAAVQPVPEAELAAMHAKFLSDFSNGLVGQHHNSVQHRARVLRRLDAAGLARP